MAHLGLHGVPPAAASGAFRTGDVLDGKYRIERVIAEGGIAIVVQAEQLGLDRHVAIKLLRPEVLADREIVEHFRSEGSLAAKIKSEHVVRIHDVGEGAGIGPYMVMELLEGYDLEHRVQSGAMPMHEAVDYVLQACDALAEAHHLRIVHRDIKPANLFLAERPPRAPILKIIDFGISKLVPRPGADGAWSTTDATVAGTPAYMSPEHIRGEVVDARADIWSMGVVLHELLTGTLPFPLDEPSRMMRAICNESPAPIRSVRPDLPADLEAVVLRCLAQSAADRYASVSELAAALEPFHAGDAQRPSEKIALGARPPPALDPRRHAPTVVVTRSEGRGGTIAVALGIAAVLAVIGAFLVLVALKKRAAPPGDPAAASDAPSAAVAAPMASATPAVTEATPPALAPEEPSSAPPVATSTAAGRRVTPPKPRTAAPPRSTTGAPSTGDRSMFGERK